MKPQKLNASGIRFLILVVILYLCWFLGKYFSSDFQYYKSLISDFPIYLKGLVFVFLYVSVTFFAWLMKDIFKILGAVLFGAYLSTLFIWIAEMINAAVLFYLSRKLGRAFVEGKLKGKSSNLDEKIRTSGFWGIFALRIVPLVPFRFLDLAAGLTKISFRSYFAAVVVASPLRIFWIQFILAAVGEKILDNARPADILVIFTEYLQENSFAFAWSSVYLIAVITLIVWLRKKARV